MPQSYSKKPPSPWRLPVSLGMGSLFVALGGVLYLHSFHRDEMASHLERATPAGVVRGEAVIGAENTFRSLQFKHPCVLFHNRVIHHRETSDDNGDPIHREETLVETYKGLEEIPVSVNGTEYHFHRQLWSQRHHPQRLRLDKVPVYAPEPRHAGSKDFFEVEEVVLSQGQKVFLSAGLQPGTQRLIEDPQLREFLLYPGDRAQCIAHLHSGASRQRFASVALALVGVLVGAVLWRAMG